MVLRGKSFPFRGLEKKLEVKVVLLSLSLSPSPLQPPSLLWRNGGGGVGVEQGKGDVENIQNTNGTGHNRILHYDRMSYISSQWYSVIVSI